MRVAMKIEIVSFCLISTSHCHARIFKIKEYIIQISKAALPVATEIVLTKKAETRKNDHK